MWAEKPDPVRLRHNVELLRGVTPARGERHRLELPWDLPVEALVAGLGAQRRVGSAWLDGGGRGGHRIAWEPTLTLATRGEVTRVRAEGRELTLEDGAFGTLAALERALAGAGPRLFGYLGYETGAELERLPPLSQRDVDMPDLWLALHDAWLERRAGRWILVTCGPRWDARRRRRLRAWLRDLAEASGPAATESAPLPSASAVRSEPDAAGYAAAVTRTIARIHAGEIFQTNLCRRFRVDAEACTAWPLYRAMRATGDAAYGAWIVADTGAVLSRSPECFLRLRGRAVESRPIKGTRRRGANAEEDRRLRRDLATSDKDRAELAMIVDLVRNDLGRVCAPGSVAVPEHARMLELPGVWHTVSRIRGRLRSGVGPAELLRATFPAGSITGAPKIQAMVVAAAEEPRRRGPAMGAAGWLDPGGDLELSVAIRTAVAAQERVVYHAGCGIVADSDPEHEQQESLVKARPFLAALNR